MSEFNLLDEPWIPCIDQDGRPDEYGIRETLLRAHELREICDDSPLVTVAIHRLLLAILYRANGGPASFAGWKTLHTHGCFDSQVSDYLDEWTDRFFLFDNVHPFMQVAGLDLNQYKDSGDLKKDNTDGLMRLSKAAPDKKGRILFDHRVGTERPEYELRQTAKMLLECHSYAGTGVASGGMIGSRAIKPTPCQFALCVDGVVVWLQGKSLFETLMLNLVPHDVVPDDLPPWEDGPHVALAIQSWKMPRRLSGQVQRFIPLSRFVRIMDTKSMFFTNGTKFDLADDFDDPMKVYRRDSDTTPYTALKLLEHKATWRDAHSLLNLGSSNHKAPACINLAARLEGAGVIKPGAGLRANAVGLYRDPKRVNKGLLWRHDRMPVPIGLLGDLDLVERLGALLRCANSAGSELGRRIWEITKLFRTCTKDQPSESEKQDIKKLAKALDPRPAYWARLERHFYTLLESLPKDRDAASRVWRTRIKQEAQSALEESIKMLGTSARAVQAIARVRTTFGDADLEPSAKKTRRVTRKGEKNE